MKILSRIAAVLAAAACCLWLRLPAAALAYTDDFSDSQGNNSKSYANLGSFPMDASYWSGLPDRTAFSFASASPPTGSATYRVQNARQVTVGLYTTGGSFAVALPDGSGTWVLGIYNEDIAALSGRSLVQASYSPSARAVYASIGGALHKAYAADFSIVFAPTAETPGDLVGYGVNVYTSATGQSWSRVPLSQSRLSFRPGDPFVYEEFTGTVPAGAGFVRVELNDVNQFPGLAGPAATQQKNAKSYNCLASVSLSGENMTLGVPEPVQPEPTVPSQATQATAATQKPTGKTVIIVGGESGASAKKESASSKFAGSKFEGVIEHSTSSKEERKPAGSSKADSKAARFATDPTAPSPAAPEEALLHADDNTIYQIASKNGDDKTFTAAVIVYIIVVTAALAFIVLASAGRKK